jgi:two-component system, chemotaxis family, chemotaxis protein CheY
MTQKFILVDDDSINNVLSQMIIETVVPEADIQVYTDPETALLYLQSTYTQENPTDTVLFLDIYMPSLTGWEFLEAVENLEENVKEKLKVYMLSSSVDPRDKERAADNKKVLAYFEKLLTLEFVKTAANRS